MKIARRADHKRMAWKNGQGLTEEVAAFPAGSDTDSFDWRLSIAHVGADGPFSVFAGIDRTIALLDGPGLALDLPKEKTVELKPGGSPFSFSGDWEIASRNLGGPTVDLNIMTRRGRCTHEMRRMTLAPGETFPPSGTAPGAASGASWAVFNSSAHIEAGGQDIAIERFDAIALDAGESFTSRAESLTEILHVSIAQG